MNKLFDFDKEKITNYDFVIGTDEAGRGPGAGPVFAAAAVGLGDPDPVARVLARSFCQKKKKGNSSSAQL